MDAGTTHRSNPTRILRKHSAARRRLKTTVRILPSSRAIACAMFTWIGTHGYIGEDAMRPIMEVLEFGEDAGVVLACDFAFAPGTTAACTYKLAELQCLLLSLLQI